jgi:NADH-quinone oxidoreductase subunit C
LSSTEIETAEAPAPRDDLREDLVSSLKDLHPDAILGHHIVVGKDLWVRVANEAWAEVANSVRFTMGARYFGFLAGIDWLPSPFGRSMDAAVDLAPDATPAEPGEIVTGFAGGETRFQVMARMANLKDHWGITLKADVGDENPQISTLTKVFAGADWHERETNEMYGIDFIGHPKLRNIYLPTDFEGHPLRKDFPLVARMVKPWPGIVDVEPMPDAGSDSGESAGEEAQ